MDVEANYATQPIVYTLHLKSMTWSLIRLSVAPSVSSKTLCLFGHSCCINPLSENTVLIVGGKHTNDSQLPTIASAQTLGDKAIFLSLNLDTFALTNAECTGIPLDARLDQAAVALSDKLPAPVTPIEKIPTKKKGVKVELPEVPPPPPQELVLMMVYGGTRLNSPGFCSGDVWEYARVMKTNQLQRGDSHISHYPSKTISFSEWDCSSRPYTGHSDPFTSELPSPTDSRFQESSIFSSDSLSDLLTCKYTDIKSALTNSRSMCLRSGTNVSDFIRAPTPEKEIVLDKQDAALSRKAQLAAHRLKIKNMSERLEGPTRGMRIHEARHTFHQLFPMRVRSESLLITSPGKSIS